MDRAEIRKLLKQFDGGELTEDEVVDRILQAKPTASEPRHIKIPVKSNTFKSVGIILAACLPAVATWIDGKNQVDHVITATATESVKGDEAYAKLANRINSIEQDLRSINTDLQSIKDGDIEARQPIPKLSVKRPDAPQEQVEAAKQKIQK